MSDAVVLEQPRTTTDMVFEHLHEEILSLKLLPGARISEAEFASKLGVSRQPVRDAFNRLGHLGLLKIRPQRATLVSGFDAARIENARFIRLAVELQVLGAACQVWEASHIAALEANLDQQRAAIAAGQIKEFHALDYDFHRTICFESGHALAFDTVLQCKQQVDRLCVLSLARDEEVAGVLDDHQKIAAALAKRDVAEVEQHCRRHFQRLDPTIQAIQNEYRDYFE